MKREYNTLQIVSGIKYFWVQNVDVMRKDANRDGSLKKQILKIHILIKFCIDYVNLCVNNLVDILLSFKI